MSHLLIKNFFVFFFVDRSQMSTLLRKNLIPTLTLPRPPPNTPHTNTNTNNPTRIINPQKTSFINDKQQNAMGGGRCCGRGRGGWEIVGAVVLLLMWATKMS